MRLGWRPALPTTSHVAGDQSRALRGRPTPHSRGHRRRRHRFGRRRRPSRRDPEPTASRRRRRRCPPTPAQTTVLPAIAGHCRPSRCRHPIAGTPRTPAATGKRGARAPRLNGTPRTPTTPGASIGTITPPAAARLPLQARLRGATAVAPRLGRLTSAGTRPPRRSCPHSRHRRSRRPRRHDSSRRRCHGRAARGLHPRRTQGREPPSGSLEIR